jgi:hypothetical protein
VGSLSWSALEYAYSFKEDVDESKDSKRLYPKDITKYEEQLPSEQ